MGLVLNFCLHYRLTANNHDAATRFVRLLTRGEPRNVLLPEDFIPLVQDVVETHPGLTFLKEATEFHARYVHTVCFLFCLPPKQSNSLLFLGYCKNILLRK